MANYDKDIILSVDLNTEAVEAKAERLTNDLTRVFERSRRSFSVSDQFKHLMVSMDRLIRRSQDLRDRIRQIRNESQLGTTAEQQHLNELIQEREQEIANARIQTGADYIRTQERILELDREIRDARTAANAANQAQQQNQPDYGNLIEQLNVVNNQMTVLKDKAMDLGGIGAIDRWGASFMRVAGTIRAGFSQIINDLRNFPLLLDSIFNGQFRLAFLNLGNIFHTLGDNLLRLKNTIASVIASLAKLTVTGVIKGLKALASYAAKAATNLAKMAGSNIKKGILSLGNAIKSLGKHTKSSNNMLQVGFKQFIRYGLGMRSVFTLIRKLRRAFIEGLESLGEYDVEFGNTITKFKESLVTLKNSFASAFAPVVQVVLPILTQLIDKLSQAFTLLGKFLAALTGKTSFTQATRAQKQYKNAVDKTGKAVKEAKRELYGFDEITKQQDDTASTGGTGDTGPDSDDIVGGFKTVPIDGWLKDLADKIRNFFKSKDWIGLGTFLGESINSVFQKAKDFLDNPALLNRIYEIIDAITTTFNSLVSSINWELIGSTFASGINLIVNAANRLVTGIDWKTIGVSIATGLNGLISNINWNNIANLLSNGINSVFSVIGGFVRTFDWKGTASKIASAFNNMIKNINWAEAGKVVSDAIKNIFSGLAKTLEDINWKEFGEKVKEFLVNIDWAGIAQALFEAIGAALGGLAAFLWGLIEDAWNSVVGWFKDATKDGGKEAISGLFNGIVEALKNVGQWIKDHIFKPFIDGFKNAFEMNSPSKKMAEMGKYVIQGLLNGILSIIKNIGSWIKENIFGPIKKGLSTVFGIAGGIAKNLVEVGKSIVGGIKNGASNAWNTVSSVFSKGVDNIRALFKVDWASVGATVVRGIHNGVSNLWGNVTGFFSRAVQNIRSFFTNTNWYSIGTNICNGIRNGLANGVNAVVQTAKNVASRVLNSVKSFLGIRSPSTIFRDEVGKMIPAGLAIGIDDNASKAINSVNELGKSITSEAMGIKVPAIAAGNVVPYNSTNSSTTAQNSMIESMLSKLAPIIQSALMNAISESDGFDVTFNVNGDPNKLFTVVREKGLQFQQMTGKPVFD